MSTRNDDGANATVGQQVYRGPRSLAFKPRQRLFLETSSVHELCMARLKSIRDLNTETNEAV